MLDQAHAAHPDAQWWIKGDGCDVVCGLKESVTHQWSGDVDFNDGQVQKAHEKYCEHLQFIQGLGLGERCSRSAIVVDLKVIEKNLSDDLDLLVSGRLNL